MMKPEVYGIYVDGRILCQSCAEKLYGNSLVMYLTAGEIQSFKESDRTMYATRGLLCDDCSNWIFQPENTGDPWWLVDPDAQEHLRLLAPFADFLETLKVDVMNLRNIEA